MSTVVQSESFILELKAKINAVVTSMLFSLLLPYTAVSTLYHWHYVNSQKQAAGPNTVLNPFALINIYHGIFLGSLKTLPDLPSAAQVT